MKGTAMPPFQSSAQRIPVGPGTLYVAPLGTTEPTSVTGAWPANWVKIGYTDKGNDFSWKPSFQAVEVNEELWPVRQVPNMYEGSVAFSMAEYTVQNNIVALNGGIGSSQLAGIQGNDGAGTDWFEPPAPGEEVRIMVGWDAANKGATPVATDPILGRAIYRQCIQTGEIKASMQKGSNKKLITVTYSFENPATGLKPFRELLPVGVAT